MTKNTKILIQDQLPDFVIEDHPRFVSFLEAYYEFLGDTDLSNIGDIDYSLESFEDNFFNSFLPYIKRDTKINKEYIFKNILPLFLSKGSEKSFKYFFRVLFDKDAEISYPGQNILRASSGHWTIENILRLNDTLYSEYYLTEDTDTIFLPDVYYSGELHVYINNIEVESGFSIYPELLKIVFDTPVAPSNTIKITYDRFDITLLNSRKATGLITGTTAIIETSGIRKSSNISFFELLINTNNLSGTFQNGELVSFTVIKNDHIIPIIAETFSNIDTITITNPGTSYNIGDPVIIRGESNRSASAVINDVTSGMIENIYIINGGAGFAVNDLIYVQDYTPDFFTAHIAAVNDSGLSSCNNIVYNTDVISLYSNTLINSANYAFSNTVSNSSNTLASVLHNSIIDHLGGITLTTIDISYISSQLSHNLYVNNHVLYNTTTIKDLGVIGEIHIANSGSGYSVGDKLIFNDNVSFSGHGANAYVSDISNTGGIEYIRFNSGGLGYKPESLPTITINTANGIGANVIVSNLMGYGYALSPMTSNTPYGTIKSIKVLDSGIGYKQVPIIDLSGYGDGTAKAEAVIRDSYINLDGKWTTSDGLLSTRDIVLQGRDYYIDYSYVIKVEEEFSKFKDILKKTIHPIGTVMYSNYTMKGNINIPTSIKISSSITIV